jgi:hypothetical protein
LPMPFMPMKLFSWPTKLQVRNDPEYQKDQFLKVFNQPKRKPDDQTIFASFTILPGYKHAGIRSEYKRFG